MTIIKLRFEKTGRTGGAGVTVAEGFSSDPRTLDTLLSELKKALGTGGTRKGWVMEFQGDLRTRLRMRLEERGFKVKG